MVVYGDGACSGNPGPGGWAFLLVDIKNSRVIEKSGGETRTTNNRMELMALVQTLEELLVDFPKEDKVEFYWDSSYVVNGFNQWLFNWSKRDFTKADGSEISNLDLWKQIWALKLKLPSLKMTQVPGHSGLPGNERVDELSVAQAKNLDCPPFIGSLSDYPIDLADLTSPHGDVSSNEPQKRYPAYLSLIAGTLTRHVTWDECKAHVHGKSAKFKKVKNPIEENQILKAWQK